MSAATDGRLVNEEQQQKAPAISSGGTEGRRGFPSRGRATQQRTDATSRPSYGFVPLFPPDLGRELYAGILQPATGANLYRDQPFHWSLSPIGTAHLVRTALPKRAALPKDGESWQRSRRAAARQRGKRRRTNLLPSAPAVPRDAAHRASGGRFMAVGRLSEGAPSFVA
jgi:hypothetical protein